MTYNKTRLEMTKKIKTELKGRKTLKGEPLLKIDYKKLDKEKKIFFLSCSSIHIYFIDNFLLSL